MIANNPSKEQYKIAIKKLSVYDRHKLAEIYYYYPVYDMNKMAEKMKLKNVGAVNLVIGRLNTELYFHSNFKHPEEEFTDLQPHQNGRLSIIHHELHEVQPSMQDVLEGKLSNEEQRKFFWPEKKGWYMIPELASALEELKLVTPKSLNSI